MHYACIVRSHYWIRGAESTRDPAGNKKQRSRSPQEWICSSTVRVYARGTGHDRKEGKHRRDSDGRRPAQGAGRIDSIAGPSSNPIPYGVRVEHVAINNLLRREGRSLQRHTLTRILSPFLSHRLRVSCCLFFPFLSFSFSPNSLIDYPFPPFLTLRPPSPPPLDASLVHARRYSTAVAERRNNQ